MFSDVCWIMVNCEGFAWIVLILPLTLHCRTLEYPVNANICDHYIIRQNESLRLNCSIPDRGTFWSKLSTEGNLPTKVSNDSLLIFEHINIQDAGVFRCSADNSSEMMETKIIVHYPPVKDDKVDVITDLNVDTFGIVECPLTGNPPVAISWRRSNEELPENVLPVGRFLVFGSSIKPTRDDYICTANNRYGNKSVSLTISQSHLSSDWYLRAHFVYIIWPLCGAVFLLLLLTIVLLCKLTKVNKRIKYITYKQRASSDTIGLIDSPKPKSVEQSTQTVLLRKTFKKIRQSINEKKQSSYYSNPRFMSYVILPPDMSGTGEYEYVNPKVLEEFFSKQKKVAEGGEDLSENAEINDPESLYENAELYVNSSMLPDEGVPVYLELVNS